MVVDEQELRQRLKATAERIGTPQFTVALLAGRIRRHRAKIIGLASASLLAVAGIAVAVPVALSSPRPGPILGAPLRIALRVSFTVAVNGQHPARLKNAPPPVFTFSPGKHLSISVGLIVHAHAKVTNLWLGIAKAGIGTPGPDGQRPPRDRTPSGWPGPCPRTFPAGPQYRWSRDGCNQRPNSEPPLPTLYCPLAASCRRRKHADRW
jgi:hypothetical protein